MKAEPIFQLLIAALLALLGSQSLLPKQTTDKCLIDDRLQSREDFFPPIVAQVYPTKVGISVLHCEELPFLRAHKYCFRLNEIAYGVLRKDYCSVP